MISFTEIEPQYDKCYEEYYDMKKVFSKGNPGGINKDRKGFFSIGFWIIGANKLLKIL